MNLPQGWIFDLDGTLTLAQHDFAAIRRELGIPAEEDILDFIAARPVAERQRLTRQLDAIEHDLAASVQAAPGAVELLRWLQRQQLPLGIVTRNLRAVALHTLDTLGVRDCFAEAAVIRREQALPKPHPQGLLQVLGQWSLAPPQAIMVGDYRFDLEAGRAAGCRTCLLAGQNLWPALADWHRQDCSHLLDTILAGN
ncbi:MAG: HAD family hydrolase [Halopseudomonas yangmingensis]